MHHAPREFIQQQVRVLRDHLVPGGLWVQLAYPINRFRNPRPADNLPAMQAKFYGDGLSFNNGGWGGDNDKTPWAEWYIGRMSLAACCVVVADTTQVRAGQDHVQFRKLGRRRGRGGRLPSLAHSPRPE
jgi:hypothetical protein